MAPVAHFVWAPAIFLSSILTSTAFTFMPKIFILIIALIGLTTFVQAATYYGRPASSSFDCGSGEQSSYCRYGTSTYACFPYRFGGITSCCGCDSSKCFGCSSSSDCPSASSSNYSQQKCGTSSTTIIIIVAAVVPAAIIVTVIIVIIICVFVAAKSTSTTTVSGSAVLVPTPQPAAVIEEQVIYDQTVYTQPAQSQGYYAPSEQPVFVQQQPTYGAPPAYHTAY